MYSKALQNKLLRFKNWKANNLNHFNNCERELLQLLQRVAKISIVDFCRQTNFCEIYEHEYFAQVYCNGKVDVDYQPFINFANKFKFDKLKVM